MQSSSQKMSPSTSQHPVFLQAGCPCCRSTNSVKAPYETEQRITITVLGDVVPGRLVHVVLVVSGKNLFLHRFVTAVWTEWRISSQTEHTQRQCESYIYTAQSHTASLIDCLQPFDIPYRLCCKFQASTQNCTLHGGVLCPSIYNVNCVSTHICLQLLLIVVHCILFYFIVIY